MKEQMGKNRKTAAFMADSQLPIGLAAFVAPMTVVAWKNKPVWYLAASDDRMIPPDAERFLRKRTGCKVSEIKSSHAVYVSYPKEVAALLKQQLNLLVIKYSI